MWKGAPYNSAAPEEQSAYQSRAGIRCSAAVHARFAETIRLPLLIVAALACLATPAQRFERNYPAWVFDEGADGGLAPGLSYGCAAISAWVSKSGKEGMGVSFEIQNATVDRCTVQIVYAAFVPDGQTVKPHAAPGALELPAEEVRDTYVGFAFDNEALWNEGRRTGVLHVTFNVQGEIREFRLKLRHALDGFQRERHRAPRPVPKRMNQTI